jgi:hypothetical protein
MKSILSFLALCALSVGSAFAASTTYTPPAGVNFYDAQFMASQSDVGTVYIGTSPIATYTVGGTNSGYTAKATATMAGGSGSVMDVPVITMKVTAGVPTGASTGTGYTVNDVLTLVSSSAVGTAATVTVASVTGGVINTVTVTTGGSYTTLGTLYTCTGGTGTGATFTPTYGINTMVIGTQVVGGVTYTGGFGFLTAPTVTLSGTATATATLGSLLGPFVYHIKSFTPTVDSVISAATFPAVVNAGKPYSVIGLVGKTLKAGITYKFYADSVTLSSGHGECERWK